MDYSQFTLDDRVWLASIITDPCELAILALDSNTKVRIAVAKNPKKNFQTELLLSYDRDARVRLALTCSTHNSYLLSTHAGDSNWIVRLAVAINVYTSIAAIKYMTLYDKNALVRLVAKAVLKARPADAA